MAFYRIQYIDGFDLRYKTFETEADSAERAIHALWEMYYPDDFDHELISVNEIPFAEIKDKLALRNARYAMRETKALDAFTLQSQIFVDRWSDSAQEYSFNWKDDYVLDSLSASHGVKTSRVVLALRPKETGPLALPGQILMEYYVTDDKVQFLNPDTLTLEDPFPNRGFKYEVLDWYENSVKNFHKRWLNAPDQIRDDAEAIVKDINDFGEEYDYYDFHDGDDARDDNAEIFALTTDVTGEECMKRAAWFYSVEAAYKDAEEPSDKRLFYLANSLRVALTDFASEWFHKEFTEDDLKQFNKYEKAVEKEGEER